VTSPSSVPDAPELPNWLPDEATLNRLAGEFFAALPGSTLPESTLPGSTPPESMVRGAFPADTGAGRPAPTSGVEQAPRVDVPASANDVPQAPGSGGGVAPGATTADPTGAPIGGAPGLSITDPVAASGVSPSRAFPDVSEGSLSALTAFGVPGAPPESPLPAFDGLQLADAGELTPPLHGLAAPLPGAGLPGLPASDQAVTGGGVPVPSMPDTSAAAPFSTLGGIATPGLPTVPTVPGVTGATGAAGTPGSGASGGDLPDGFGGVPALPTGLPSGVVTGSALPSVESYGAPSVPQPPVAIPDPPVPVPIPSTPYYFIAETSPYRGADGGLDALVSQALGPLMVQPPELDPSTGATGGRVGSPDQVPGPLPEQFYFTDRNPTAPVPAGGGHSRGGAPAGVDRHPPFDVQLVRRDFPILAERVNGKPLVWLDNAATTQKPQAVLDRLAHFYQHENSNIHRAAHELAARATDAYEGARKTVARFIGAGSEKDIIFVRGATEAINLVAKSWGKANVHRGDEIIVSHLEHHANIVPWQQLIAETGAKLRVIPVDDSGQLIMSEYSRLLSEKTKIVAVTQVSNALGTVTPVEQVVEMGHRAGACVLIDGAQSVPHLRVNMQTLGADFFVFSGHKIFGPTGIGVVYGRPEVLEKMPPWEGGGNMIADVTFEKTVYQKPPTRFEAGTGNIADAVGLGAALDYVSRVGLETIAGYEHALLEYATPRMLAVPGLHMIGTATNKASVLSFVLDGYRTEEVGTALNQEGIAVRSGHHCAQPILRRFGLETTVRPSLAFYNTYDEIDLLVAVLHRLAANRGAR
jgi:cysteine desulfurase/selenocysteine lyase